MLSIGETLIQNRKTKTALAFLRAGATTYDHAYLF